MENKQKKREWLKWVIIFAMIIIAIIIAVILFKPNETYISDSSSDNLKTEALSCTSKESEDAFFVPTEATSYEHGLKATFRSDVLDKLFYTYEGEYPNNERAAYEESRFHADYNIYMGDRSLSTSLLSPAFSAIDNKVKITLFANQDNLNINTVKFFFLSADEFQRIKSLSLRELMNIYQNLGFDCIHEK